MNLFPKTIPITVLTGFLGSGKTTLLSEFVRSENVNDVAFIINEFGEVGLDHHLIDSTDETILELQNGCICCTIQEDLKSTLLSLLTNGPLRFQLKKGNNHPVLLDRKDICLLSWN